MSSESGLFARAAPAAALAGLRERLDGTVLEQGDDAYEETAAVWNREVDSRPALIVRCRHSSDVAHAVRFAREHDLPIAVRGGGYSPAGLCTGPGVMLDLRPMNRVLVDPLGRVAVVGGGSAWGVVDAATQHHGYVVPGVPLSQVGVAGSTIGGGFGHLRRTYGLACDNLTGADLITAEGERLVTSGDLNPELLWGLRGGGGNFGIVTSMRFRLHPLPEAVLSGPVFYAAEHAPALLRFYRDYTARLREDITTRLSLYSAPHSPALRALISADVSEPAAAIVTACVGHPDDVARLMQPIRDVAPVLADRLAPQPYARLQAGGDAIYPPGQSAAVASVYVDDLDDDLIAVLIGCHAAMPLGASELHVHHMGGAVGRVARMSTAVPQRATRYLIVAMTRWAQPADAAAHCHWLATTLRQLRGRAVGGPHVGLTSEPVTSVEAYGPERYLRLAALKHRYDPDNVFAGNQNITPLA